MDIVTLTVIIGTAVVWIEIIRTIICINKEL